MSKSKYDIDKLILIENNIKLLFNNLHEKDDYLKANNNRHYLNEIIIKNQNDLLRQHNLKIEKIELNIKNFNRILMLIISIIICFFYIYFHKNK